MGTDAKIAEILIQENYKFDTEKIFRLDKFGEWSEQRVNQKNQIQLVDEKGVAELFDWDLVRSVLRGETIGKYNKIEMEIPAAKKEDVAALKDELQKRKPAPKELIAAISKSSKEAIAKSLIRSAEIKLIRKMVGQNKTPSEISKALGKSLHSIMYITKQIKAGKKLKYEK